MCSLLTKHRGHEVKLVDYLRNLQQLVDRLCSGMGTIPWQDFFMLLDAAFTMAQPALVGSHAPPDPEAFAQWQSTIGRQIVELGQIEDDTKNVTVSPFGEVRELNDDGEYELYWNNLGVDSFLDGGAACYWYSYDGVPGGEEGVITWGEYVAFL